MCADPCPRCFVSNGFVAKNKRECPRYSVMHNNCHTMLSDRSCTLSAFFSRKPIVNPTHIVLTHARDGLRQMVTLGKTYANLHTTLTLKTFATAC